MRAFLSDPILRANIGTRILVAALMTPFALVLALIFVPAALFRYALTGRRPDDFGPPRDDPEAAKLRDALRGATIH